jgi:hypothetical protein
MNQKNQLPIKNTLKISQNQIISIKDSEKSSSKVEKSGSP